MGVARSGYADFKKMTSLARAGLRGLLLRGGSGREGGEDGKGRGEEKGREGRGGEGRTGSGRDCTPPYEILNTPLLDECVEVKEILDRI